MRNLIIVLLVFVCGLMAIPNRTFAAASLSDIFVTPAGDISFFGGYIGGDGDWVGDPNGALDWSIGNRPFFGPSNTDDLVISTSVEDWHFPENWFERMRITKDGKVGIGTATPNETLVVGNTSDAINQNIRVRSQEDVALILESDTDNVTEDHNPYISFQQDGSAAESVIGMSGGSNIGPDGSTMTESRANALVVANKTPGARIQFMTNNSTDVGDRVSITGDGNVGIGTPNPQSKLDVNGGISIEGGNGIKWKTYSGIVGVVDGVGTINFEHGLANHISVISVIGRTRFPLNNTVHPINPDEVTVTSTNVVASPVGLGSYLVMIIYLAGN